MRCDQYMGLNKWAQKRVNEKVVVRVVGKLTKRGKVVQIDREQEVPVAVITVIESIAGAYKDHVANLHRYTMPSGVVYEEYVQETIWCGGPNYYIALRRLSGKPLKRSLWSQKQLSS